MKNRSGSRPKSPTTPDGPERTDAPRTHSSARTQRRLENIRQNIDGLRTELAKLADEARENRSSGSPPPTKSDNR